MTIYSIVLEKFSKLDKDCFCGLTRLSISKPLGAWAVLGHFDAMYTYKHNLNQQRIFTEIDLNNKMLEQYGHKGSFIHPLYIIPEKDEEEREDQFWKGNSPFWAVARIHFSDSVNITDKRCCIKQELEKINSTGCTYRLYKTVELSDMVLAVYSNQISKLLRFVLTLRQIGEIGRVYTYCGVRIEHLKNYSWDPDKRDVIDFLSMRFSVTDYSQFKPQLEKINGLLEIQNWHSIVGVDDVLITAPRLSVQLLVGLYREWFFKKTDSSIKWGEGISGVTTRVGITMDTDETFACTYEEPEEKPQIGRKALKKVCYSQKETLDAINKHYTDNLGNAPSWLQPIKELVNNLIRISETVVLDEFVYLLYPSVSAFLQNTLEAVKENTVNELNCYKVIESCTHLTEHIMRSEGQLTHQPELRPVIYDISIAMLEYTLAFLDNVADILQGSDGPKQKVSFLLVPRLCERLEGKEIYSAHKSTSNGEDVPGLVLVNIPLENLCKPDEILRELCHEISHFVGEKIRNRLVRTEYFRKAASTELSHSLFKTSAKAVSEAIDESLSEYIKSQNACEMLNEASDWLAVYLENQSLRDELVRKMVEKAAQTKEWVHIPPEMMRPKKDVCVEANELLGDIKVLFRECYADLCMLTLLPNIQNDYIDDMKKEANKGKYPKYEVFAIRIYVSLYAKNKTGNNEEDKLKQEEILKAVSESGCQKLYDECLRIKNGLETGVEEGKRRIPISSIRYLLDYTRLCYESLRMQLLVNNDIKTIQTIFENVRTHNMDYDSFLENIDKYRQKSLGLLVNNENA